MGAAEITITRYTARFTDDVDGLGPVVIDLGDVDGRITPEDLEQRVARALAALGPGDTALPEPAADGAAPDPVKPPPSDPPPPPAPAPAPAPADPPAPAPVPAAAAPSGLSAPPGSCARHLLTVLADMGGVYQGKSTDFARTHWARSPGAGGQVILKLTAGGALALERTSPRTVKSITMTAAGWALIGRDPVDAPPPIGDLGPMAKTPFDPDKARSAAGDAL